MKRIILILVAIATMMSLAAQTRLKDISKISGMDDRYLMGYGLVTGLQGTGDSPASSTTIQSVVNMLEHFNLSVPDTRIRTNNVAAVMITATMPPFATNGSTFDIEVSAMGDARSLEGGILLMSPLLGEDRRMYAVAQGPILFGGYSEVSRGSRVRRGYTNAGRIPNGAIVRTENSGTILKEGELKILLNAPDFTTAERAAEAINNSVGMRLATADNASSITVIVPDEYIINNNLTTFIANIENLPIVPETSARVVINERTGTIVAGGNVRISEVAIAHGNLMIRIATQTETYTTGPFSLVVNHASNVDSTEESARVFVLQSSTVQELAQALNAIKVTPRDLISIFQSLKEAGALMAELRVI